jgi:hypothetical protein
MIALLAGVFVAAAIAWGCARIAHELQAARTDARRTRLLDVITMFAPALDAASGDPKAILLWEPLARTARQLFPDEFGELDRASGQPFPFGPERIQAAHAQWTADWLAWERAHDAAFKLKAVELERECEGSDPALTRAKVEGLEREKLDIYQRKYQEYVQVGKALQALTRS